MTVAADQLTTRTVLMKEVDENNKLLITLNLLKRRATVIQNLT